MDLGDHEGEAWPTPPRAGRRSRARASNRPGTRQQVHWLRRVKSTPRAAHPTVSASTEGGAAGDGLKAGIPSPRRRRPTTALPHEPRRVIQADAVEPMPRRHHAAPGPGSRPNIAAEATPGGHGIQAHRGTFSPEEADRPRLWKLNSWKAAQGLRPFWGRERWAGIRPDGAVRGPPARSGLGGQRKIPPR